MAAAVRRSFVLLQRSEGSVQVQSEDWHVHPLKQRRTAGCREREGRRVPGRTRRMVQGETRTSVAGKRPHPVAAFTQLTTAPFTELVVLQSRSLWDQ